MDSTTAASERFGVMAPMSRVHPGRIVVKPGCRTVPSGMVRPMLGSRISGHRLPSPSTLSAMPQSVSRRLTTQPRATVRSSFTTLGANVATPAAFDVATATLWVSAVNVPSVTVAYAGGCASAVSRVAVATSRATVCCAQPSPRGSRIVRPRVIATSSATAAMVSCAHAVHRTHAQALIQNASGTWPFVSRHRRVSIVGVVRGSGHPTTAPSAIGRATMTAPRASVAMTPRMRSRVRVFMSRLR